jgi:hypothetical protein
VDPADHYLGLVKLGHDVFVQSVAPAALVRLRPGAVGTAPPPLAKAPSAQYDAEPESSVDLEMETFVGAEDGGMRRRGRPLEIYPLVKKPSAPFPDMITIGRTPNNDVVLKDATVSRLHAFFRLRDGKWFVGDGGSKNGTFLEGAPVPARREREVASGQIVRIGELQLTFYTAEELFKMLSLVTP